MAIYFIADTHFGHGNIIRLCERPFNSLEEMNETMVSNWNARVHRDDHVYIIGDLCWRDGYENALQIVKRLKGVKHLVVGNHDRDFLKYPEYREQFVEIAAMLYTNTDKGHIIMCHYPMAEWNGIFHGAWHIHGHIHNRRSDTFEFMKTRERALNAGADIVQFMPVVFTELMAYNEAFKSAAAGVGAIRGGFDD